MLIFSCWRSVKATLYLRATYVISSIRADVVDLLGIINKINLGLRFSSVKNYKITSNFNGRFYFLIIFEVIISIVKQSIKGLMLKESGKTLFTHL